MKKYTVEKNFESYHAGDIILLNDRQAKWLLYSGLISPHTRMLLDAVTAAVVGPEMQSRSETYQATMTGTGAVAAEVDIEYSDDKVGWLPAGTITLSGTNTATGGFADDESWAYVRANLKSISGTGAAITVTMGI